MNLNRVQAHHSLSFFLVGCHVVAPNEGLLARLLHSASLSVPGAAMLRTLAVCLMSKIFEWLWQQVVAPVCEGHPVVHICLEAITAIGRVGKRSPNRYLHHNAGPPTAPQRRSPNR